MVGIWATHCTNAQWLKSTQNCLIYSAVGKPKILKPKNNSFEKQRKINHNKKKLKLSLEGAKELTRVDGKYVNKQLTLLNINKQLNFIVKM